MFKCYGDQLELHVLTHSVPTRRSSDLAPMCVQSGASAMACPRPDSPSSTSSEPVMPCRASMAASTPASAARPACSGLDIESRRNACRSEEHTSELQSLMRISYAVFCLKKKKTTSKQAINHNF